MRNKISTLGVKKIILLTGILLVVITFSGCGHKDAADQVKDNVQDKINSAEEGLKGGISGEGGVMASIKDALTSNKTLECTHVSNEDGLNMEVKSYMQGEKYKTEFLMDGKKNNSIFDGKVSYSWEEGGTQGVKIDMDCLEDMSEGASIDDFKAEEVDMPEEENTDIFEGAENVDCKETGAIDFTIPKNIDFVDQCELLKNQQEMMKNLEGQIPEGFPEF